jgi:magnesium-transporting ATPase (P-type)
MKEAKSYMSFVMDCFEDPTLKVLVMAAVVSLVVGVIQEGLRHGWYEGGSILFVVGLISLVTATNNYSKE